MARANKYDTALILEMSKDQKEIIKKAAKLTIAGTMRTFCMEAIFDRCVEVLKGRDDENEERVPD